MSQAERFVSELRGRQRRKVTLDYWNGFQIPKATIQKLEYKDISSVPTLKSCTCGSTIYVYIRSEPAPEPITANAREPGQPQILSAGRYQIGVMQ